ncbi:MAG: beta-lactamase family protein [Deltaproteobacteria bacterium]|nr:MAG: beta-lactamase family protein [Deltaproteobacteria bacterium]
MAPVADVPEIRGSCDERFAEVRSALARNFRDHGEVGAAVAITIEGRLVVDLWAGWADRIRTRPWQRDTLVNVFSVGKAMAALSLLVLVERGRVDLDAPAARYWPEFAARGKSEVTVHMLLCHRAGLPAIRRSLPRFAMYDWELMTSALAAEEPWWEPGRTHGYHVNTFGFLIGEIVRRVSGESIGAFFRREVAAPLGADFHFGIGPEHDQRIADYLFGDEPPEMVDDDDERQFLLRHVYLNPPGLSGFGTVNTRAWRAAEMPSTNGHASARAVARIYSVLACGGAIDGVRLLRTETIERAIAEASSGPDLVLRRPSRFGLGFQLTQPERPLGTNPRSFGHFGAGGSLGFADPDAQLAFAYTMNQPGPRWQNPRNRGLIDAVYASL